MQMVKWCQSFPEYITDNFFEWPKILYVLHGAKAVYNLGKFQIIKYIVEALHLSLKKKKKKKMKLQI